MSSRSHITTVVFDVFETIAHNSQDLWVESFGEICRQQVLRVDAEVLWKEWRAQDMQFRKERQDLQEPEKSPPFKSYEEAWRDSFSHVFAKLDLNGDPTGAARHMVLAMGRRELYSDAAEALPLIQRRWRTGILSNADDDYLCPVLERLGLQFDAVLSSEAARCYKPLPSLFLQILERLGVTPLETVYVGDNQFDDVQGAKWVGMQAAWINRKGAPLDPTLPVPDYQIESLMELPQVLEG